MISIHTAVTKEDFDARISIARIDLIIAEQRYMATKYTCDMKSVAEARVRLKYWEDKKKSL